MFRRRLYAGIMTTPTRYKHGQTYTKECTDVPGYASAGQGAYLTHDSDKWFEQRPFPPCPRGRWLKVFTSMRARVEACYQHNQVHEQRPIVTKGSASRRSTRNSIARALFSLIVLALASRSAFITWKCSISGRNQLNKTIHTRGPAPN